MNDRLERRQLSVTTKQRRLGSHELDIVSAQLKHLGLVPAELPLPRAAAEPALRCLAVEGLATEAPR